MAVDPQNANPQPHNEDQWVFPGSLPGQPTGDEPEVPEEVWVTLCSLPADAANALAARLELHGLPSQLQTFASADPPPFDEASVTVRVREEDLESAEEVRSGPPQQADLADDLETPAEREKRKLANWVCPKCDRQNLQLLPMSIEWQQFRLGCAAIALLPFFAMFIVWAIPLRSVKSAIDSLPDAWFPIYILLVGGMSLSLARAHRDKQCSSCGYSSQKKS